jgi:hypothetical protein
MAHFAKDKNYLQTFNTLTQQIKHSRAPSRPLPVPRRASLRASHRVPLPVNAPHAIRLIQAAPTHLVLSEHPWPRHQALAHTL